MDLVMKLREALPAPFVREARDGALTVQDASQPATVVIPVDAKLRAADYVTVFWDSTGAGPTAVSRAVPGSAEGREFAVVVPAGTVAPSVGRQVQVHYLVDRAKGGDKLLSGLLTLHVR